MEIGMLRDAEERLVAYLLERDTIPCFGKRFGEVEGSRRMPPFTIIEK